MILLTVLICNALKFMMSLLLINNTLWFYIYNTRYFSRVFL